MRVATALPAVQFTTLPTTSTALPLWTECHFTPTRFTRVHFLPGSAALQALWAQPSPSAGEICSPSRWLHSPGRDRGREGTATAGQLPTRAFLSVLVSSLPSLNFQQFLKSDLPDSWVRVSSCPRVNTWPQLASQKQRICGTFISPEKKATPPSLCVALLVKNLQWILPD